jgi:hypothetical protein
MTALDLFIALSREDGVPLTDEQLKAQFDAMKNAGGRKPVCLIALMHTPSLEQSFLYLRKAI